MLPTKDVRMQIGELLAADDTILAPAASGNKVALIVEEFTPDENLVIGDLTLASFNGSTPKVAGTGTQAVGTDPATGQQIITILEPAGGWRWECGADPAEPQTVYGFCLMNNAGDTLYATQLLDNPVTISEAGQEINLGSVKMIVIDQPLS